MAERESMSALRKRIVEDPAGVAHELSRTRQRTLELLAKLTAAEDDRDHFRARVGQLEMALREIRQWDIIVMDATADSAWWRQRIDGVLAREP